MDCLCLLNFCVNMILLFAFFSLQCISKYISFYCSFVKFCCCYYLCCFCCYCSVVFVCFVGSSLLVSSSKSNINIVNKEIFLSLYLSLSSDTNHYRSFRYVCVWIDMHIVHLQSSTFWMHSIAHRKRNNLTTEHISLLATEHFQYIFQSFLSSFFLIGLSRYININSFKYIWLWKQVATKWPHSHLSMHK